MRMEPEEIFRHKEEITNPAAEVMAHLHQAVIALPEFALADGRKAKTEDLQPPQVNDDGELSMAYDVAISDGSHLELTTRDTGWGGMVQHERAVKRPRRR